MTDEPCDRCGGTLVNGKESRGQELLCSACVNDEAYQREPIFCVCCDRRITGLVEHGVCADCSAVEQHGGPDILELAKAGCEDER